MHGPVSSDGAGYYADAVVQQRIREYCGSSPDGEPSCAFVCRLAPDGFPVWETAPRLSPRELPFLFAQGWDLARSLRDRESLIVYFEIEISDPEAPAEPILRPAGPFARLEPLYGAVMRTLAQLELPLLDVMTGRGYHFVGRVPLSSRVVDVLARRAPAGEQGLEAAFTALGMVLEHVTHEAVRSTNSPVPVVLNGVEVGRVGAGREAASIDLTAYSDPLDVRHMRVAFGTYQSPRIRPDVFGEQAARDAPLVIAVPRRRRPLQWMLERARDAPQASALARREHAEVPEVSAGVARAVDAYDASSLRAFHAAFYSEAPHGPERWADTYDRLSLRDLPPCVARALAQPNDALLRPTVTQHLTRCLLARGWSAPHVAGLVWSKYARDHGWGDRWTRMRARRRAEFDVRVFAGMLAVGLDAAIDFNCVSTQEKGLCPGSGCTRDLRDDRRALLERGTA